MKTTWIDRFTTMQPGDVLMTISEDVSTLIAFLNEVRDLRSPPGEERDMSAMQAARVVVDEAADEVLTLRAKLRDCEDQFKATLNSRRTTNEAGSHRRVEGQDERTRQAIRGAGEALSLDGRDGDRGRVRSDAHVGAGPDDRETERRVAAPPVLTAQGVPAVAQQDVPAGEMPPIEVGDATQTCERCQMKLHENLGTFTPGVRGSMAWRCAACLPIEGPSGRLMREHIIMLRRQRRGGGQ